jgi:hypothetical protein
MLLKYFTPIYILYKNVVEELRSQFPAKVREAFDW